MHGDRLFLYHYGQNYGYSHRRGREAVTELNGTGFDLYLTALGGKVKEIEAETGSLSRFVTTLPQDKRSYLSVRPLKQHELEHVLNAFER
jgi:hypothetical protein